MPNGGGQAGAHRRGGPVGVRVGPLRVDRRLMGDHVDVPADLAAAVATVRDRAAALRLGLEVPGVEGARRSRHELVGQVEDYLLPRLGRLDAPLLAVVGGSTGAGKSTLVNTLVGAPVSAAGVLRPTTRLPVLLCAPQDE